MQVMELPLVVGAISPSCLRSEEIIPLLNWLGHCVIVFGNR